jgi:hypothetical protein
LIICQRVDSFLFNRHYVLCQTIPELSLIFNAMRGQLKDLHMLGSVTQREDDWKTDAICNLLYSHPATTRSEIIFSIEESMKRVHMPRFVSLSAL